MGYLLYYHATKKNNDKKMTDILYDALENETFKLSDSILNKIIGSRLKSRRQLMGLNQVELGKRLNISGQQIHKYEAGVDQLSAAKIFELSEILQIPVTYFFDDLDAFELGESENENLTRDLEEIRLQKYVNIYKDFSDPKLQKLLFEVTRLFATQLKLLAQNNCKISPSLKHKPKK